MKKGCLLAVLGGTLLLLAGGGVALYQADRQYGLWQASEVSHETLAEGGTRLRLSLRPARLSDFLVSALPPGTELPSWVPVSLADTLPQVLPHEIALLGKADYRHRAYDLTLFVNERRGGPFITQMVNDSGVFQELHLIRWKEGGMALRERGVLTAEGALPLPDYMEDLILEHWTHSPPASPLSIEGGHDLELALDNRNGDALSLWGAGALASGEEFKTLLEDPTLKAVVDTLPEVHTLRLAADLADEDTIRVALRIEANPNTGPSLQFMLGAFVIPTLQQSLRDEYGISLKGDAKWVAAEAALAGEYTLTGIRKPIMDALGRGAPAAAPVPSAQP